MRVVFACANEFILEGGGMPPPRNYQMRTDLFVYTVRRFTERMGHAPSLQPSIETPTVGAAISRPVQAPPAVSPDAGHVVLRHGRRADVLLGAVAGRPAVDRRQLRVVQIAVAQRRLLRMLHKKSPPCVVWQSGVFLCAFSFLTVASINACRDGANKLVCTNLVVPRRGHVLLNQRLKSSRAKHARQSP